MLCPDCGMPRTECETTTFEAQTRICQASAAVQQWREQNGKPPPGTMVYPVPATADTASATVASAPDWWLEKQGLKEPDN